MTRIVEAIAAFAEKIGGPGLFLIAFLDSSFLSFPQANDLLVIVMVLQRPELMPYYAALATAGSVIGCLVLHHLAARGGEAFLEKRAKKGTLERAMALTRRYGMLAVLVPSLLPPPAPFKLFVLLAGVARVPRSRFALTVAVRPPWPS
jgi:membrane protein YqaA with SNARE-associated domain